ncbi:MAG: SUMF1/EgtB/PvdO family nonheme iron enzyme [Candidatus Brocadiaceae bacterium]|jgi:formylglycine-generating enzyme required for sulfatase activity/TolA-binding protein
MQESFERKRLGKFELMELIEEGVAGQLYRARDTEHERRVLLKIVAGAMSQNPAFGRYFYDKWSDQQSLVEHPNVLRVWEVGEEGDRYYVALEDTTGRRLSEVLPDTPLDSDEALDIVHQIAEALRAIHRRNVTHGDLKPSDIFLTRDRLDRRLVKMALFDLGVSSAQGTVSVFGEMMGSPKYMSPEVIRGRAPGAQADIFALGVIAYELFTGREPFPSDHPVGYLFSNCEKGAEPADQVTEGVPHEVALVIHRMLEKEPPQRYRSVERVIDDLDRCVESIKTGHVQLVPFGTDSAFARDYELPQPRREGTTAPLRAGHLAALLLLVAVLVGVAGYTVGSWGRTPEQPRMEMAGRGAEQRQAAAPAGQPEQPSSAGELPVEPPHVREQSARRMFDRALADWQRLSEKGQYELGVAAFRDIASRFPDTPYAAEARNQVAQILVEWAETLASRGDYQSALENYQVALETVPENSEFADVARRRIPSALAGLAEDARRRGQYMEALQRYERIAEQYPGTMEASLLEGKKPELLFNHAGVLKEQGLYERARDLLLQVLNGYPDTEWSDRARKAVPDVYLSIAGEELKDGDLAEARRQIRQIVEAYPEHEAAKEAAEVDARILLQFFDEALARDDQEAAQKHYAELLALYPNGEPAVQAVRARLGLQPDATERPLTANLARSRLRKAQEYYGEADFANALDVLKGVLRNAPAGSAAAAEALDLLPRWMYESAVHACGTDARDLCTATLQDLISQFAGTPWQKRGSRTLERLQNPPDGMVYVPEGTLQMGTDLSEIAQLAREHGLTALGGGQEEIELLAGVYGFSSEVPKHTAATNAFFIDKTEVTNKAYKQFVAQTGHPAPGHWSNGTYPQGAGDLPVVNVTLSDARAYAGWRGARLPTEQEWEKAARGVDGRMYPWGSDFRQEYCRHMKPENAGPVPVGSFPTWDSPYGCLDAIGNVMEWTSSSFAPYAGNALDVPTREGKSVVRRGGSWRQEELPEIPTRCASRYPAHPAEADRYTGFRCVVDVGGAESGGGTGAAP